MPPKKVNHESNNRSDSHVVLYDKAKSEHLVPARSILMYAKKDNLRVGTYATFQGEGDRSFRFRGQVIMEGK